MTATQCNGCNVIGNGRRLHVCDWPPGFLADLTLAYAAASQLTLNPGACRDALDAENLQIPVARTLDLNVLGLDGLDAGAKAANTWYAIYAICNPNTGAVAGLISTVFGVPTLPAGFTCYRRVGCARTDAASNWYDFYQEGGGKRKTYHWNRLWTNTRILNAAMGPAWAAVSAANFIAPVSRFGHFGNYCDAGGGAPPHGARFRPTGSTQNDPVWRVTTFGYRCQELFSMPVNFAQSLDWRSEDVAVPGNEDRVTLWVIGYDDEV